MKLLIHPSLPTSLAETLAANPEWTTTHWSAVGPAGANGADILAYASQHGYVVVSADLGMRHILFAKPEDTPSVLQVRDGHLDPDGLKDHVFAALKQMERELAAGALITLTISPTGNRFRTFPLAKNPARQGPENGFLFSRDAFLHAAMLTRPEWPDIAQKLGKLCINVNRLSLMRLQEIEFGADDASAIVSALLFSQATTSFEASCILACTGMECEARAQARNGLEAAIVGYALAAKPELDIIGKLNGAYKRHYVTLRQSLKDGIGLREDEPLDAYIQRIIKDMEPHPVADLKLEQLAKGAGVGDMYLLYRFLSAEAGHPTWDSLRKSAAHHEATGQVIGINLRPRFERIEETLGIAAMCQLAALKGLQVKFPDRDVSDTVELYLDVLRHMALLPIHQPN
ncbi:MAG: DUF5615 family PIN-like protein [Burkholderiaceae bacterium]|nr:DUF5615 family PIN-like protein [Burkholderiaceae bacterium]